MATKVTKAKVDAIQQTVHEMLDLTLKLKNQFDDTGCTTDGSIIDATISHVGIILAGLGVASLEAWSEMKRLGLVSDDGEAGKPEDLAWLERLHSLDSSKLPN